jgi:hypothetical protein
MAITVKHNKVSTIPDGDDTSVVRPSDWNADHTLTGTVPVANGGTGASTANDGFNALVPSQTGNSGKYLTTDGTNSSWATNPLGTVTSVTGTAPVNVATGTTTPVISLSTTGTGNVVLDTGATQANPTISNYENFTPTTAPSYSEGRVWYDSTEKALAFYNDSSALAVHVSQDLIFKVINNTGSTIPNGSPVYVTGTSSGQTYPNVALAKADVAATSSVIGLTNGAIANGAIGYVTSQGTIDNVNTGTFTVGQVLYLSPYSAGQLMNTIPPTGITVQVGVATFINSSTGHIYVKQTTPLAVPASIITGTLGVDHGGTGATTLTGYVKGSGTSAMTASSTIPTTDLSGTVTNAQLANSAITINGTSTSLGGSISVGTVTSVAATAGTGISVSGSPITGSGTLTVTNTAPDQTVVLTAGTGISTSGTYPNFTITNTAPSSGGTVTSVTGTAPVVSSGGNTPAISMPAATTSVSGYLTSTDWNTFNGKGSGTVTSVTATSPVTSTGGATPVIAIPAATTSVNGYLTSTDWTTFNGKQASLVSGTNIKTVNGTTLLGSGDLGTIGIGYGGTGQTTATAGFNALAPSQTSNSGKYLTTDGTNTSWATVGGGGKVLQVVQTVLTTTATASVTSPNYVDTGLSATITPSSSTSKILVFGNIELGWSSAAGAWVQIVRGSTAVGIGTGGSYANFQSGFQISNLLTVDGNFYAMPFSYLDSPATTSATTYKIQGSLDANGTLATNRRQGDTAFGGASVITLMEIGA